MTTLKPMCFVLMPFGVKADPTGGAPIDFNAIYNKAIRPAIEAAGLEPIRADEESAHGIIHKAMFERLLLCEFAVADLTTANANVFYELGVRHAARPAATLSVFAAHHVMPFDVNFLRGIPYALGEGNRFGEPEAEQLRTQLAARLGELRARVAAEAETDSPIFQLIEDWRPQEVSRLKTDVFRERARLEIGRKQSLAEARARGDKGFMAEFRQRLAEEGWNDVGASIDLLLSLRAVSDWHGMVELVEAFPGQLRRVPMVREQYAFALNRRHGTASATTDDRERAIRVLEELIGEQGPTSESCGLLGRIYKDQWTALKDSSAIRARGFLRKAIDTYRRGFEADWRDAYPGINAVTLMVQSADETLQAEAQRLLPVVRYAVERRIQAGSPDYWDHATLLELSVIGGDASGAEAALSAALATLKEPWQAETTARNLSLLSAALPAQPWIVELLDVLLEECGKS